MKGLHIVAWLLLIIGGLNWLVLALFNWEIGMLFGGQDAMISKLIYILVGLSALFEIFTHKKNCRCCAVKGGGAAPQPGHGA